MNAAGEGEGSERELLMHRAARLEKLLEQTYEQLEKLEASASSPESQVLDAQAENARDDATEGTDNRPTGSSDVEAAVLDVPAEKVSEAAQGPDGRAAGSGSAEETSARKTARG